MRIAFFGSSLLSAYWNGAATYYRGLLRALAQRGHAIAFYEPDAFDRQSHRDIDPPPWAEVIVYPPTEAAAQQALDHAHSADLMVKASGVGVLDAWLEQAVIERRRPGQLVVFWDVDAPATLAAMAADAAAPLRQLVPAYDLVLTYGGGPPVVERYLALGAQACVPVYNALDPSTHFPVSPEPRFRADLTFLGNRLPDREARVTEFFLRPAALLPERRFLLGGSGWGHEVQRPNLACLGHVSTNDHNALNSSALAVLNIARDSMAAIGWSPATRIFEAAGGGACIISDAWPGLDEFLEPGREILVGRDGAEVATLLDRLDPATAATIGAACRRRVLAEHTYDRRAALVESVLTGRDRQRPLARSA
jgi:spore maturation protein CgeB